MSKLKSIAQVKIASSSDEGALRKEARDATVIISGSAPMNANVMNSAPNLKGIISYGVGFNHIDLEAAAERGIFVANLRGSNSEAVAELTVTLMLSLVRGVPRCDRYVKNKKWDIPESAKFPQWTIGEELYGKTLGLVGIGEIGKRVARICGECFNMRVLASDPFVTKEQASQLGAELVGLPTLLKSSDIITVHVPLTPETRGLIGGEEIGIMKKSAYVINTSRGPVVDEAALVHALKEGKLAGAGLDVFEKEPVPLDSPLLALDNVVLTPHIGGNTREAFDAMNTMLVEEVARIIRGNVPKNLVNRSQLLAKGYVHLTTGPSFKELVDPPS